MPLGFWSKLPRPFTCLAPMSGVTDVVCRRILARCGRPDVMYTWFVACDGLCSPGREHLLPDLWYDETERPIVAQVFGAHAATYERTAALLAELRFDGIDINCGCPDRAVEKQGAGASLIRQPARLAPLVAATRAGAPHLPISIKTRLGYDRIIIEEWMKRLLDLGPAAIILHARTRDEMSDYPCHWDAVARAVALARAAGTDTLVVGNGDVTSLADARRIAAETGVDGIMIGRGIFGNPWVFSENGPPPEERWRARLRLMVEHTRDYERTYGGKRHFDIMKKFYKAYVSGFPEAKDLRVRLMETHGGAEVEAVLAEFCQRHGVDLGLALATAAPAAG